MLNQKPIQILVTYTKYPQINGFRDLVEQTIQNLATDQIGFIECHISEVLEMAQRLVEQGTSIILSTGATAGFLQKKLSIEIHPIHTGAFDVLQAISNLKDCRKIALVANQATINLANYADVFALEVKQFRYDSYLSARHSIQQAKQQGFDAVIGSPVAVELAQSNGLKGQLALSHHSLQDLCLNALQRLDKIRQEQQHLQHLTAIFDHLSDGICVVDQKGHIYFANAALQHILEMSQPQLQHQNLNKIFKDLSLNKESNLQSLDYKNKKIAVHLAPMHTEHLEGYVLKIQELQQVERSSREFRKISSSKFTPRYQFSDLITQNSDFKQTLELAQEYAKSEATVLITGESGTGKELLAQSIHQASLRQQGTFVAINCAAFPESILESELFGYEEGAFTGARKNGKLGLIEAAHQGTLFLDEIGDMPLHLQTRFLRVLQERQVQRLGALHSHAIDIRVIAATHCHLEQLIAEGRFRADLYYRLNILRLEIPSLNERREDILHLSQKFLARKQMSWQNVPPYVVRALNQYHWPGNIRELENVIERLSVILNLSEPLTAARFKQYVPELFIEPQRSISPLKEVKHQQEHTLIRQALEQAQGNLDLAAQHLNISRTTLWRKMKYLNLKQPEK